MIINGITWYSAGNKLTNESSSLLLEALSSAAFLSKNDFAFGRFFSAVYRRCVSAWDHSKQPNCATIKESVLRVIF